MLITNNTRLARFIRRPNRFVAIVDLDDTEVIVHVPNTGRNKEILVPGYTVVLREENNPNRRTKYDLIAGYKNGNLINIDSQIPNKVVDEALKNKKIESLKKYGKIKRECTFGNSRFDFKLEDNLGMEYYLEVKGVTYENNGRTSFPDAPTERGRKHLLELVEVLKSGKGAGVLFLIQMEKVDFFTPYDEMDKSFGEALRFAAASGVEVFAYNCSLGENYITLNEAIEIRL